MERRERHFRLKEIITNVLDERNNLIKDKKLRKVKVFEEIQTNEITKVLPIGWVPVRWQDLLYHDNYSMKRGPFGSALKKDFFVKSGVRVFEQYNPINDDPYYERYYVNKRKNMKN